MCGLCGGRAMPRRSWLKVLAAAGALGLAPAGAAQAAPRLPLRADLILHNARVHTGDRLRPTARAVAIGGNRILAAGGHAEVLATAGPRTRWIDLGGRAIVPGLNDSHLHQFRAALDRTKVPLLDARRIADVVAAIGRRARETPAGSWIEAQSGWHESLLAEGRMPTRHDLDPVSPDHPVYIPRGGHVATTNGHALRLAGITRDTPDPDGGRIVRDAGGAPTGVLLERATTLVEAHLPPPPPPAEQRRLLREQLAEHNALGITSVTEPGLTPEQIGVYTDLWRDGELTVRTHLLWRVAELADVTDAIEAFAPHAGDDVLRFDGLKYLADGGVEGAFLHDPYEIVPGEQTDPDYRGTLLLPPGGADELRRMYLHAARHGFQVQTHVVGDAATDVILGLLERVDSEVALERLRWTLMHLFLPGQDALRTMRRLGLLGTVQDHAVLLGANQVRWWGRQRGARAIPIRDILDAGIRAGGGTDAPVAPTSPMWSMDWMATRRTLRGDVLGPEQAITPREALELYTTGSATTQFAEHTLGTLRPGMLADLVVLDADPLSVPPRSIGEITAELTIMDGRIVHDRLGG